MKILMHICCINCLIYPSQSLRKEGHDLTGLWFNPNIHPHEEYIQRLDSLKKHAKTLLIKDVIYPEEYRPDDFFSIFRTSDSSGSSTGIPNNVDEIAPLFPDRCISCYKLRLEKTAEQASEYNFDAFTTTLLISPYQNFDQISLVGKELADRYNIAFRLTDFRPYFSKSMAAAREIGTYRQKYCGCIYSMKERFGKLTVQNKVDGKRTVRQGLRVSLSRTPHRPEDIRLSSSTLSSLPKGSVEAQSRGKEKI